MEVKTTTGAVISALAALAGGGARVQQDTMLSGSPATPAARQVEEPQWLQVKRAARGPQQGAPCKRTNHLNVIL